MHTDPKVTMGKEMYKDSYEKLLRRFLKGC